MEYKYIIIGMSTILIEIISIFFNVMFLEEYKNKNYIIISSSLNLISLILFSVLWIKDLLPIFFVFLFIASTIGHNQLWFFISKELREYNNYFSSVLIFNYIILFGLAYSLKYLGIGIFYCCKNAFCF